jgi:hypothetical protein
MQTMMREVEGRSEALRVRRCGDVEASYLSRLLLHHQELFDGACEVFLRLLEDLEELLRAHALDNDSASGISLSTSFEKSFSALSICTSAMMLDGPAE